MWKQKRTGLHLSFSAEICHDDKLMTPKAQNIILIGFMGAGKTTVGQILANLVGLRFIDLDAEIIRLAGRSIPEIFAHDGEDCFRDLESQALSLLADQQHIVLATGGGIVGRPTNWELMRRLGRIIYLQVPWEALRQRLSSSSGRPLAHVDSGWDQVQQLYERRLPLYQQADIVVDGGKCGQRVAESILRIIRSS